MSSRARHGHARAGNRTPTYVSWQNMRARGRGKDRYTSVTVCPSWGSFAAFLTDMGERPPGTTLDRIDNERGYESSNCRWATRAQQSQNRRCVKMSPSKVLCLRSLCAAGVSQSAASRHFGINVNTAHAIVHRKIWL